MNPLHTPFAHIPRLDLVYLGSPVLVCFYLPGYTLINVAMEGAFNTEFLSFSPSVPSPSQGLTFFLTYAIFASVLGMLQFGYNTGVINAPEVNIENFMKDVYKDRYGEDISEQFIQQLYSVAVSIFAIGGMLGGFSGGWMANRFGR